MSPLDLRPRRRRRPVLNVTSLIDVLFLLLIFFMVSSTFIEHPAIELELPRAASSEPARVEALTLRITRGRELFLDGQALGLEALEGRFRAAVAADPGVVLVLEADRRVDYGLVIAAIDAARQAGVRRISAFTAAPEP